MRLVELSCIIISSSLKNIALQTVLPKDGVGGSSFRGGTLVLPFLGNTCPADENDDAADHHYLTKFRNNQASSSAIRKKNSRRHLNCTTTIRWESLVVSTFGGSNIDEGSPDLW